MIMIVHTVEKGWTFLKLFRTDLFTPIWTAANWAAIALLSFLPFFPVSA